MDLARAYYASGSFDLAEAAFQQARAGQPAARRRSRRSTATSRRSADASTRPRRAGSGSASWASATTPTSPACRRTSARRRSSPSASAASPRPATRSSAMRRSCTAAPGRSTPPRSAAARACSPAARCAVPRLPRRIGFQLGVGRGALRRRAQQRADQWRATAFVPRRSTRKARRPATRSPPTTGAWAAWRSTGATRWTPRARSVRRLQVNAVRFPTNEIEDFNQVYLSAHLAEELRAQRRAAALPHGVRQRRPRDQQVLHDGVTTKSKNLLGARSYLQYSLAEKLQLYNELGVIYRKDKDDYARSTVVQNGHDTYAEATLGVAWQFRPTLRAARAVGVLDATPRTSTSTISTATRSVPPFAATCSSPETKTMIESYPLELKRVLAAGLAAAAPLGAFAASGEFTFVVGDVSLVKAQRPARGVRPAAPPVDRGRQRSPPAPTAWRSSRWSTRRGCRCGPHAVPDRGVPDRARIGPGRAPEPRARHAAHLHRPHRLEQPRQVRDEDARGHGRHPRLRQHPLRVRRQAECDASVAEPRARAATHREPHHRGQPRGHQLRLHAAGTPAQQGGASTLITGPGQTVLVAGSQPPRYIPTPQFIADSATNMTERPSPRPRAASASAGDTRNFAPSDNQALPPAQQREPAAWSATTAWASRRRRDEQPAARSVNLHDIVIAARLAVLGPGARADIALEGSDAARLPRLCRRRAASTPRSPAARSRESQTVVRRAARRSRWAAGRTPSLGFFGPGSGGAVPGQHPLDRTATSGYPDLPLGRAHRHARPTRWRRRPRRPTSSTPRARWARPRSTSNFTNRTLNVGLRELDARGGRQRGRQLVAERRQRAVRAQQLLRLDRGPAGRSPTAPGRARPPTPASPAASRAASSAPALGGRDPRLRRVTTRPRPARPTATSVAGVAAFTRPAAGRRAPYRDGRVSDPTGTPARDFIRTYATTDRPDEVIVRRAGARHGVHARRIARMGAHATYAIGTAQVVQSGVDPETGMVWGRWGGGTATVSRDGQTARAWTSRNASLHYIFAGAQSGPVALPLTGTGDLRRDRLDDAHRHGRATSARSAPRR